MKNMKKKYLTLLAVLFISALSFAQGPEEADEEVDTEEELLDPAAPIGDYIIPMLLIGVFVAYRFLKQENVQA